MVNVRSPSLLEVHCYEGFGYGVIVAVIHGRYYFNTSDDYYIQFNSDFKSCCTPVQEVYHSE